MTINMRIGLFIAFIAVVAMHVFIYFVLLRNISDNPMIKHFGKLLIIINVLCIFAFLKLYHTNLNATAYTILSSSIGIFWISFCIATVSFVVMTIIKLCFGSFVLYKLELAIVIISWCFIIFFVALSFYLNAKKPIILENKIHIPGLHTPLNIVLLSDMHIDMLMNKAQVKDIVDRVNQLKPDIIALSGDIVDSYYQVVRDSITELGNFKASYGTYYVLGNHEYHYDTDRILESLQHVGIHTLVNQSITIDSIGLNIVGIADIVGNMPSFRNSILAPDLQKTLASVNKDYPTILLAHQPKIIKYLDNEQISLILSGHTHGGQIFPFNYFVLLDQPFLVGLHTFHYGDKQSQIFISRGAGWWGMPMRLFARREINLLRLES